MKEDCKVAGSERVLRAAHTSGLSGPAVHLGRRPSVGACGRRSGSRDSHEEQPGIPRWRALVITGFVPPFPSLGVLRRDLITLGWAQDLLGHLVAQLEDPSGWQMIFLSEISHQEQRRNPRDGNGLNWGRHPVGASGPEPIV